MPPVSTPARLLVVSHACVTPINQELFAEVERQTGWEVHLVVPSTWKADYGERTAERWDDFTGPIHPLPVIGSGNIPLHIYRALLLPLLQRVQPDAVFVHHEPYGLATAQWYAANAVSMRAPIGFFSWQNIHKRYPPPIRQFERLVYRHSSFALSGSDSAADVLRAKGYTGPLGRMPGTIHPERFRPRDNRTEWCVAQGLDPAQVLVGYAGRLVEPKGLFTLLQAVARLNTPKFRLVLMGKGEARERLEQEAERLDIADRLHFIPYVPHEQMPEALSAMDLMVLPSETQPNWKEQFGRIIIESLACGTPLVGSSSGEIPHLLGRLQQDTIFPEGNAEALAQRLSHLIERPSVRASAAGRGRTAVLERYTVQQVAAQFVNLLSSHANLSRP